MGDILKTNRENIKAILSLFLSQIKDIENLLASDDIDLLQEMLEHGADRYNQMIRIQN
jgi:hypothetical protein